MATLRTPALDAFSKNLTQRAADGRLDPVIGRDDEIRRVIQVLSRRTKNNPLLIGEPGVGKTAIVEGLAQRIVRGDVPTALKGKRLQALDLTALVAGASLRGEVEKRIAALLREIDGMTGEIVLFIDEIHTLVKSGTQDGIADSLKPALARGELRCIGATTLAEFKKYIEKDAALERRFQPVKVAEPTNDEAIAIMRGLKDKYEEHHGVRISDDAIVSSVVLAARYVTDRFLPDKAIDLIDESASRLRVEMDGFPVELDVVERRIAQLSVRRKALRKEASASKSLAKIEEELATREAEAAVLREHWMLEKKAFTKIRLIKSQLASGEDRMDDLMKAVNALKQLQTSRALLRSEVDGQHVADAVARWTGVPVSKLDSDDQQKLLTLEDRLHERVVGQVEAVDAVSQAVRRGRAGLGDPDRPIGSFIFLGPTGVGKTEIARSLASVLFDDETAMVRIDMSEYGEKHTVSRLIGSPPGYVGYDEGGQLTEAVRRKPYSVVLLDEIEKAHPDVFNVFLQLLDDGRLTDGQGRTVSFKNVVVVMTSNAAEEDLPRLFRPEFLNRVDEVIKFHPLTKAEIRGIVSIQLKGLVARMADRGLKLVVTPLAMDALAEAGYDPQYGARPLKRAIQRMLQDPLSTKVLQNAFAEGDTVVARATSDGLVIEAS